MSNICVGPLSKDTSRIKCFHLKTVLDWTKKEHINPLTPNDHYSGPTAPQTSKRCFLYIYPTNIGTEYFKHGIYSPFFFSICSLFHNSIVFGSCIIHILYIYSTNIGTEYFKHGIYSPVFSSSKCSLFHKSNLFGSCIIHILYIYSTNIRTEYFKHGIYSPFFPLQIQFFYNSNIWFLYYSHFIYLFTKYRYRIF